MVSGTSHTNLSQDFEHSEDDLVDGGFDETPEKTKLSNKVDINYW